jgi:hypothetical protein
MDMPTFLNQGLQALVGAWRSLDADGRLHAWLAAGALGIIAWAWSAYLILRRLAGYRKFHRRWYSREEYARLMALLWQDQQSGSRVMSRQELEALRAFRYGSRLKPILSNKGGGYFDV